MRAMCVSAVVVAVQVGAVNFAPPVQAGLIGPTSYAGFSGSPFSSLSFDYFYLDNFEDGAPNITTPGATASYGWSALSPGSLGLTDSVDEDDGAIDGSGNKGWSFYSNGQNSLTITFNATLLGDELPTHVGIVWTDVGFNTYGYVDGGSYDPNALFGDVEFSAIDANGIVLGPISAYKLGDGAAGGLTAEDRFFGAESLAGIKSFTISMSKSVDWEVDHLQYGYIGEPERLRSISNPEPASLLVWGLGSLGFVHGRRRRRG